MLRRHLHHGDALPELPADGQTERLAVEAKRAFEVHGTDQDPTGEDVHEVNESRERPSAVELAKIDHAAVVEAGLEQAPDADGDVVDI